MKFLSKFAALALLLLMTGLPVMACLAPATQLTAEEQACCRSMADQCGASGMSSDHSCCQKIVSKQKEALIQQLAPIDEAASAAAFIAAQDALSPMLGEEFPDSPTDRHPPPESPPSRTVLRI